MSGPNSYSELFFLDEATAFSAGHRPCAECRRPRYDEFKTQWLAANGASVSLSGSSIREIDKVLDQERIGPGGEKITFSAPLSHLPPGTFIEIDGVAPLIWEDGLRQWSFSGYSDVSLQLAPSAAVRVLTPASRTIQPQCSISAAMNAENCPRASPSSAVVLRGAVGR